MTVKKETSGRRSVQVEVEVPGTPEQVWRAIATGPGISAWFAPTRVEERVGGTIVFELGPGMDSAGAVTRWEPPREFGYEERDWGKDAPPLATEILVEARSGGLCRVRLVHSLFAGTDAWDQQLESMESGWPGFFRVLRVYLAHFAGQPCAMIRATGGSASPEAEAWRALTQRLGLTETPTGARWRSPAGVPRLEGKVEHVGDPARLRDLLLRLDEPAPGIAMIAAGTWGGQVILSLSLYLYGDQAGAVADRDRPVWQAWMDKHFRASDHAMEETSCR